MPVSQSFIELLRELLSPVGEITVRKMFGGASIYADGILFALVDDDVMYLKGDARTAPRFEAEGLSRFTYDGQTGPVSMSYWRAPERLFDDADEMAAWAREAIAVARAAKKPAPKAKPSKRMKCRRPV
jgi:DNA transformation protein